MKKILLSTALVAIAIAGAHLAMAQNYYKIRLKQPGTLQSAVKPAKLKKHDALSISGTLNNSDIKYLRSICGRDAEDKKTEQLVKHIDLTDVIFENSGDSTFFRSYSIGNVANVLPSCIFFNTGIESLKLPSKLDSIAPWALSRTALKVAEIPRNVRMASNALISDSLTQYFSFPPMSQGISPKSQNLRSARRIEYGDMDYLPSGSFKNMPDLEEVVFNRIGHIDGYLFRDCPKLKRIIFRGPVMSTGGKVLARNCPELEEVKIEGLIVGMGLVDNPGCPKAKYDISGIIYDSADSLNIAPTPLEIYLKNPDYVPQLKQLAETYFRMSNEKGFLKRISLSYSESLADMAKNAGLHDLRESILKNAEEKRDPDEGKSKLQILKEASPYTTDNSSEPVEFLYTAPEDSLLTLSREYFNLDSIAGTGPDSERIKNLMYWVHDLVRHDGSSKNPTCALNLRDIAKVCKDENRGVNCRMMAIMLTEALLAEGIPSRYLTCQPKAFEDDPDCHVICIAWAEDLGKWIWVDPTMAAYVTDEHGLLLHPGEVRRRLREDLPLILNEDANWNHKSTQTKEEYLDNYMAKNLYFIEAIQTQKAQPEGEGSDKHRKYILLAPPGSNCPSSHITIHDENIFWQAPKK